MEEQQRKRYHNMMLAQQIQYLKPPLDTLDKLLAKVGKIGAERYAGILHDKDIGEEDHIHLFMHFKNSRDIKAVAKALNIAPQYILSKYLFLLKFQPVSIFHSYLHPKALRMSMY